MGPSTTTEGRRTGSILEVLRRHLIHPTRDFGASNLLGSSGDADGTVWLTGGDGGGGAGGNFTFTAGDGGGAVRSTVSGVRIRPNNILGVLRENLL